MQQRCLQRLVPHAVAAPPTPCSRRKGIAEEALTLFMAYCSARLVSCGGFDALTWAASE